MTNKEAIDIITTHLHECAMLMPIEWLRSHGDGTSFQEAFEMAIDALKESSWIPCNEKLPEKFVSVLGYDPGEKPLPPVHECYLGGDGKWHSAVMYGMPGVTHWRPMITTPEEDYL